eukprot:750719-Hanusia_phi.AAC.1
MAEKEGEDAGDLDRWMSQKQQHKAKAELSCLTAWNPSSPYQGDEALQFAKNAGEDGSEGRDSGEGEICEDIPTMRDVDNRRVPEVDMSLRQATMSWTGASRGGRTRFLVGLSALLLVAIIAVASIRRESVISRVELKSLDPACQQALQAAANALGWSSLEEYEHNLIEQGKPVKCGDRVVKLKDTSHEQNHNSEDVIQWLFGSLFDDHAHSVKKKTARKPLMSFEKSVSESHSQPHVATTAGTTKFIKTQGSPHEVTDSHLSKPSSRQMHNAVEGHVKKVQTITDIHENPQAVQDHQTEITTSKQGLQQLKPLSWPKVVTKIESKSLAKDAKERAVVSHVQDKTVGEKLSEQSLKKLEKKAKELGYLLVPKSLEREAKTLGYDLIPDAPSVKQGAKSMLASQKDEDETSQLAQIPLRKTKLAEEKSEGRSGGEKESREEEEEGKGDELLGGSKARLEEEAKLESELKEHFKEKQERKKKLLKEEAQKKKMLEHQAAMKAVERYGSMLTFPDETRAKFLKLVERPGVQMKDEEVRACLFHEFERVCSAVSGNEDGHDICYDDDER